MKTLGAEDNFLMLCAGPHNRAVQPSTGRKLAAGRHHPGRDHAERTRPARADLPHRRDRRAVDRACRQVRAGGARDGPGHRRRRARRRRCPRSAAPSTRCWRPKATANTAIRRTSAGAAMGSASRSVRPGDVALDNDTVLEPDMVFMIHPEPVSAGDRLSALRRAGAADRQGRRAADARRRPRSRRSRADRNATPC